MAAIQATLAIYYADWQSRVLNDSIGSWHYIMAGVSNLPFITWRVILHNARGYNCAQKKGENKTEKSEETQTLYNTK